VNHDERARRAPGPFGGDEPASDAPSGAGDAGRHDPGAGASGAEAPAAPVAPAPDGWFDHARRGRYDLAAQTLRLGGGGDPDLQDALDGLGDVVAAVRDKAYARARTALQRIDPRPAELDWEALEADLGALGEAAVALDRREPDEARERLARIKGTAYPAETATLLGTLAVYEGETAVARERFEQALEFDPNHYRALTNLGNIKLEAGDVDGAVESYERAIRLNDGFANAHHNLGVALRRKGQLGRSVQALKRAQREAGKRDAEDARARLGAGRRGATASSSARTIRWLIWAGIILAIVWIVASR
jgi:tetratricopeptide (TPR) repeat protein